MRSGKNFKHRIKRSARKAVAITLTMFACVASTSLTALGEPTVASQGPLAPVRIVPTLDVGRVELGKQLFSDKILSSKQAFSCASCHDLTKGGTVAVSRTIGYRGKMHRFNSPTIFNVGNNYRLGWRGDFTSLEAQNEKVLMDENLMAIDWDTLLRRLEFHPMYSVRFQQLYGTPADRSNVLDALATFQRSLTTPNAPFDRYLQGDTLALSADARQGYELFQAYGCASCHQGSNIGGNMFQKFGIFTEPVADGDAVDDGDLGRWTITGADRDKGVFRVPSLRNVEVTAPYFHDGRTETLREAVSIMGRSQLGRDLTRQDLTALVAFLKSLTGEFEGKSLSAAPMETRH